MIVILHGVCLEILNTLRPLEARATLDWSGAMAGFNNPLVTTVQSSLLASATLRCPDTRFYIILSPPFTTQFFTGTMTLEHLEGESVAIFQQVAVPDEGFSSGHHPVFALETYMDSGLIPSVQLDSEVQDTTIRGGFLMIVEVVLDYFGGVPNHIVKSNVISIATRCYLRPNMHEMDPHVEDLIRQIAKNRGFNTYSRDVQVSTRETAFRCNQTKVQLKRGKEVLHLLVKTPPEDKEIRSIQKTGAKFSNEILFFKEAYPKLKKHGWNGKAPYFHCSSTEKGKEVIVTEDLEAGGFKTVNVAEGLDNDHCKLVLESLSQLHRAAKKWKSEEKSDFEKVTKQIKDTAILDVPDEEELTVQKIVVESALEAGQIHASHHFGKELEGKMDSVRKNIFNDMRSWMNWKSPSAILIHGDPWINEIAFKYDESGKKPLEVVLVNWQKMRIGSPCMDVSLGILGSASLQSLSEPTKLLDMYTPPSPSEGFSDEFKTVGRFGLTMALINVLFASAEEEIPLEQIIKGVLRSAQLREGGFKKLTMRVGGIVKAADQLDLLQTTQQC